MPFVKFHAVFLVCGGENKQGFVSRVLGMNIYNRGGGGGRG